MAGALVIVGAILTLVGIMARTKTLPRNHLVGMRTRATLQSREAWIAAHGAVAGEMIFGGVAATAAGVVDAFVGGRPLALTAIACVVVVVVHAGARADQVARGT